MCKFLTAHHRTAHILHIIDKALKSEHIPKVSTSRNPNTVVPAVHLTEAGVAAYGHMSQKNGDTAFTANIFSARISTARSRRPRTTCFGCTTANCAILMRGRAAQARRHAGAPGQDFGAVVGWWSGMNTLVPYIGMPKANQCMTVDKSKTAPGTEDTPSLCLPRAQDARHGFAAPIVMRDVGACWQDRERGDPYSSIDWVNGAGTNFELRDSNGGFCGCITQHLVHFPDCRKS